MTASEAFDVMAARAQRARDALIAEANKGFPESPAFYRALALVNQDVAFAKHMAAAMREGER